jgi:hypothetical protein
LGDKLKIYDEAQKVALQLVDEGVTFFELCAALVPKAQFWLPNP